MLKQYKYKYQDPFKFNQNRRSDNMSVKNYKQLIIILCILVNIFLFTHFTTAAIYDASGTWNFSESNGWSNCPEGPGETETGSLVINQSGNTFTLIDVDGIEYTGAIDDAIYTGAGSFPENGGTLTVNFTITLTEGIYGTGTVTWTWSDGTDSCNGGNDLSLIKLTGKSSFVNWENMGLFGGLIRDVVVDPTTGAVYAGFNEGGVYKTIDGGSTWKKILDNGCILLAIDVTNGAVYAAGNGVVKSTDGGQTWKHIIGKNDDTYAYSTSAITLNPGDPNVIYVGTGGSETEINDARIYKSIDAGETWIELNLSLNTEIWSIAVDYSDSNTIYVTDQDRVFNPDGHVWKSINGGETWTDISPPEDGDFTVVAIDPNNSDIVYVGTGPPAVRGHLYKSIDGGDTWTSKLNEYIEDIDIDPMDTNIIYCTCSKSVDGGENWTLMSNTIDEGGQIAIDPGDTQILYAGSSQGITKSIDAGINWLEINTGIEEVKVYIFHLSF